MQNVIVEKPYQFVPPVHSDLWQRLIQIYLGRFLRKSFGVHSVECRHAERLQASIEAGHGVLLAPNHCRLSDPLVLGYLAKQVNRYFYAMASWHLFNQDWFTTFMLRRIGAFSVLREGTDRQSINTAVDILVRGERPLIVFAEGAISRHNDVLMPLMEGTAFIARSAAKKRQKQEPPGDVVVHPVAIRYFYDGDVETSVSPVLSEIESHFAWYPQNDKSIIDRIRQIGEALLSLKEIEYVGQSRTGNFYERVNQLMEDVLTPIEEEWGMNDRANGIVGRVKALRSVMLPDMVNGSITAEERARRWKQLAACYYVQQISHYPRDYVTRDKNLPEHILETVERFEEDFLDKAKIHGPLHAVVEVGEAVDVNTKRDRTAAVDPLMQNIESQLVEMLGRLSRESTPVEL